MLEGQAEDLLPYQSNIKLRFESFEDLVCKRKPFACLFPIAAGTRECSAHIHHAPASGS